jgi:hypothetical protein
MFFKERFAVHFFICRPLDSIVKEDAGIELRTAAILALSVRRSNLLPLTWRQNFRRVDCNHFEKNKHLSWWKQKMYFAIVKITFKVIWIVVEVL